MPRELRVDLPDCWYHVIARGNERRKIFTHSDERLFYLRLLDETARLYGATYSAYSLVPNHVHLLIRRGRVSLAKTIQRLHGNYASYFNHRHRRQGHLFQGRYHACLVTDQRYLDTLIRYIHINLPKDGMIRENDDILWSSHSLYGGRKSPWNRWRPAPGFDDRSGVKAYQELMSSLKEAPLPPITPEHPQAYGTARSWRAFERRKKGRGGQYRTEKRRRVAIEDIVKKISKRWHVSVQLLKSSSRARPISRVRNMAVMACLGEGHGPSEISRYFVRHPTSIITVCRRYGDPRREAIK